MKDYENNSLMPGGAYPLEHQEIQPALMRMKLKALGIPVLGVKYCERCGHQDTRRATFVVHHRHYRTFRKECPEDVVILCHPCHKDLHARAKAKNLNRDDIPFVDPKWARSLIFKTAKKD